MTDEELLEIIEQAKKDKRAYLNFSDKGLTRLPPKIDQLTNLTSLRLDNNQLTALPPEIGQLSNLTSLRLDNNQLTALPPEIGQLTNLTSLNLHYNKLTKLPAEIGQLTNLTLLNLHNNLLSVLPAEIGQLSRLALLSLHYNQLKALPAEIGQLSNLSSLPLYNNQLTALSAEIGQLSKLTKLYVHNNQLTALPAEIGQLSSLTELLLSKNQLTALPAEIGQLFNLNSLNLSDNQLTALPTKIGQLTNLTSLALSNNQLTVLPVEISQLTNLTTLYLTFNRITELTAKIGQLSKLVLLDLQGNQLAELPTEIGQLSNLNSLNLSDNQLTALPTKIGRLSNLTGLYLSNNQLTELPAEIGQLSNLTELYLSKNQLKSPPPEIINYGLKAILNFCRQQLEQTIDYLYEAKLLIIGEPGAGKTTLAKKINNANYQLNSDETSTEGIDVLQYHFPLENGKQFRVNIWDFGGQEIYHSTHQFFLTERSLYTLVADCRKEDTDFYYWLNVVDLLSKSSPLLIIKNEKQDRQRDINERQLRGEFTHFKETLATNFATNRGLPEILDKIKHYISRLPHVGDALPSFWIKVREAIEKDPRDYISLENYLQICRDNGFKNKEDMLFLSGYLHDLGVFLHFQNDDLLRKTVILKPTWGTDAVYKVLDTPSVRTNWGKFTRTDLAQIWDEDKYADMRGELLRLMINFKLCYEIPSQKDIFIAPVLLNAQQPEYDWNEINNLLLRYEYEFMPKGILTRFIVETHRWIENETRVWKTGVVLSKDGARAEITELYRYHKGEIRIRLSGIRQRDLLTTIRHELEKIHQSYNESGYSPQSQQSRLRVKTLVPCNCQECKGSQSPYFYDWDVIHRFIEKNKGIQCQNSGDTVKPQQLIDDVTQRDILKYPTMRTQNKIFISYSHKDSAILEQLQTYLKPLERENLIDRWDDTRIKPGMKWRQEIQNHLNSCKIAIFLVSVNFFASEFINIEEIPLLLKAAETEGVEILPIVLNPCQTALNLSKLKDYQTIESPSKPLSSMTKHKQEEVLDQLAARIIEIVKDEK